MRHVKWKSQNYEDNISHHRKYWNVTGLTNFFYRVDSFSNKFFWNVAPQDWNNLNNYYRNINIYG